jgi:hypothetical protein
MTRRSMPQVPKARANRSGPGPATVPARSRVLEEPRAGRRDGG